MALTKKTNDRYVPHPLSSGPLIYNWYGFLCPHCKTRQPIKGRKRDGKNGRWKCAQCAEE